MSDITIALQELIKQAEIAIESGYSGYLLRQATEKAKEALKNAHDPKE